MDETFEYLVGDIVKLNDAARSIFKKWGAATFSEDDIGIVIGYQSETMCKVYMQNLHYAIDVLDTDLILVQR